VDGPVLETERLILRPVAAQDFDAFAAFCADPAVMRHLGGVQPRSMAWRGFTSVVGSWAVQGFGMFSVIERASGRWLGTEVGWGLIQDAWGQGYAVEAAAASMDFAADKLGWAEIIHCIDAANTDSQAVAKRLGSTLLRIDRLPPPVDVDIDIWGQTADQWRARRP